MAAVTEVYDKRIRPLVHSRVAVREPVMLWDLSPDGQSLHAIGDRARRALDI
jgi:hypothetical protein